MDKINVPKQLPHGAVEVEVDAEDVEVMAREEAANQMAEFWDRLISEFNVAKAFQAFENAAKKTETAPGDAEVSDSVHGSAAIETLYDLCNQIGCRKSMGMKSERATTSPECISVEALTHCLLMSQTCSEEANRRCWEEYNDIMLHCGRPCATRRETCGIPLVPADGSGSDSMALPALAPTTEASRSDGLALSASGETSEHRCARARTAFVAALAEWVNMHDLHEPFPNGPPAPNQSCAAEENGRLYCSKLYPRKIVWPGKEEISEDPRRRDLFRLWLSRNCHFLNNFVPIVILAMLSNCDFQATLTKDAVIEYMTKYMTKSGQGSLVKVMEQSFSLCLEKARENNKGTKSAMLKWFNVQSITEVKSQLETMHLVFGAPTVDHNHDDGGHTICQCLPMLSATFHNNYLVNHG